MGTGWRRAFCTRDRTADDKDRESPRKCVKLGFLSGTVGGSTPSTPRMEGLSLDDSANKLRCKTNNNNHIGENNNNNNNNNNSYNANNNSPMLYCKTTPKCSSKSTPASPRSPFAILKNSFRLHKNNCGVCLQSVKTGQGMAIFTAECAHAFHFPCIAAHVRKLGALVCPVCKSTWKDVPLLAFHNTQPKQSLNIINPQPLTPKQSPKIIPKTLNISTLKHKPYTDDEPLKTPRGGAAFVAIPEAEDEAEEFQGFFVNPVRSSSEDNVTDGGCLRNVTMELLPEVAVVSVGRSHETHAIVLKIKAPPAPTTRYKPTSAHGSTGARAPVDLVTVLDVSVSMNGAKLQMMKRAMRLVISSLGAADRLSIVAFSASPRRLLPLRRMTPHGQRSARRIIDRLATSRGSSLAEALNKATKVLEDRRERNPVASIMLLSDGQDDKIQSKNNGANQQRRGSSHESSTRFAHMEIPVNSEDGFAKCVSGLLSVVVQDLRVEIGLGAGSDQAEISAVYSLHGRPTVFTPESIRIGDLYAEEERELLVELKVRTLAAGSHHVLSVSCNYREPSNQETTINGRDQSLLVPRRPPQALQSNQSSIQRLRSLFIATRAVAESRRLIEHNELSSAYQLLTSSRALLMQSSWEVSEEFVKGLEGELAEIRWRRECQMQVDQRTVQRISDDEDDDGQLTPTSAWRAAEQLAKKAQMNRVSDLHGFENARF